MISSSKIQPGVTIVFGDVEKATFREAFKLNSATMPGVFAWGVVAGMAMVKSGLTIWQALGMTLLVFAGSAQMAVLPLLAAHAPILVIFATAMLVNLRFVIFALVIGPHFSHLNWRQRLWYGYFNADVMIALFPRRFPPEVLYQPEGKLGFFKGVSYPNWTVWQLGTGLGIFCASQIPQSWGIAFAGTLALLTLTVPLVVNGAALSGVVVAGVVAVLGHQLPYKLGVVLAVVAGMTVAMLVDSRISEEK